VGEKDCKLKGSEYSGNTFTAQTAQAKISIIGNSPEEHRNATLWRRLERMTISHQCQEQGRRPHDASTESESALPRSRSLNLTEGHFLLPQAQFFFMKSGQRGQFFGQ
jgi:hypothetical protein